jgi:excisionase family DNA binding protein
MISSLVPEDKAALFVRLPKRQIAALERLAEKTGRPKQGLVSELLADRLTPPAMSLGRIEVSNALDGPSDDVLTLEETAELFKVSPHEIKTAVESGDLPGRRFGNEWRFSKMALLTWLGTPDPRRKRR